VAKSSTYFSILCTLTKFYIKMATEKLTPFVLMGNRFSTFKTNLCSGCDRQATQCAYAHNRKTLRRNPITTPYPLEECKNTVEKMYHPDFYKTEMCLEYAKSKTCKKGNVCPFIHEIQEKYKADRYFKRKTKFNFDDRYIPALLECIPESFYRDADADASASSDDFKVTAEEYDGEKVDLVAAKLREYDELKTALAEKKSEILELVSKKTEPTEN